MASLASTYITVGLNLPSTASVAAAGAAAGNAYGQQLQRSADGRLRDMNGRFVSESALAGRRAGDGFGRGFGDGASGGAGGFLKNWKVLLGIVIPPALPGTLTILGQLVTASGALAAALPAAITAGIAIVATFKLALHGVGDAVKAAFDPSNPEKFNEALKKLAPAAQSFVREIANQRAMLRDFQQDVQQFFFLPLQGAFTALVNSGFFRIAKLELQGIAGAAGAAARGVVGVFAEASKSGQLFGILHPILVLWRDFAAVIPGLAKSFLTLAQAAMPFVSTLSSGLVSGLRAFNDLVAKAAADGRLQRLFESGLAILGSFADLLINVGSIVKSVFDGLTAGGGDALGMLGQLTGQLAAFLKTAEGQHALATLGQVLAGISTIVGGVLKALLPVAGALISALAGPLASALERVAPLLVTVVSIIADTWMPVLDALQPVIDTLVEVLADFLVAALFELGAHVQTMAPLLKQLAERLGPQLVPLVEALGDALLAVVPLIPVIAQAIVDLIPVVMKLIPVFEFMIQVTTKLWEGIAWGIEHIVVPALEFFLKIGTTTINAIASLFQWLYDLLIGHSIIPDLVNGMISWFRTGTDFVVRVFGIMRDALVGVWNFVRDNVFAPLGRLITETIPNAFSTGVAAVGRAWDRLRALASTPVSFVIDTVINRGIIDTFNKVSGFFSGPKIGHVDNPLTGGGGGGGGGRAMFNDGYGIGDGPGRRGIGDGLGLNDIVSLLSGPAKWVSDRVGIGQLASRFGSNPFVQMLTGSATKLKDAAVAKIQSLIASGTELLGGGGVSTGGLAPGISAVLATLRGAFGNVPVISGFRRGSRTLSGNVSYHASGRAIDIAPVYGWALFLNRVFGSRLRELISPWNELNIHNGQPHRYTGAVWNQHNFAGGNAHIHAAMDRGGRLMPGWNLVPNWTGRPELVTSPRTEDRQLQLLAEQNRLLREQNRLLERVAPDVARGLLGAASTARQLARAY